MILLNKYSLIICCCLHLGAAAWCRADNNIYWDIKSVGKSENTWATVSLAADSKNIPHILYFDHYPWALKYGVWSDNRWKVSSIASVGFVLDHASIVIGAGDIPHVVYIDHNSGDCLKYGYFSEGSWKTATVDPTRSIEPKLAIDHNNRPHLFYRVNDIGINAIRYAYFNGSSWSISTVDSNAATYIGTAIAVDAFGTPHLSYSRGGIYYARLNGSTWDKFMIGSGDYYTSIALDTSGIPHILCCNGSLKLFKKTGGVWGFETIDDGEGTKGTYCALRIDNRNNVHTVCYNTQIGCLTYGCYSGSVWEFSNVAGALSTVKIEGALAIDGDGEVHIAFNGSSYAQYAYKRVKTSLIWMGNTFYTEDGVNPDTGYSSLPFDFRVRYIDYTNSRPFPGYPRLHILRNGIKIAGSPFAMQELDMTDLRYDDGKLYSCTRLLDGGEDYSYYFEAYDSSGTMASGAPCTPRQGPTVSSLEFPQPGSVSVVGPAARRGIISPRSGETVNVYFSGAGIGTFECRIFNSDGELLYRNSMHSISHGIFEWVPDGIASGIYYVHLEGPGLSSRKKIAILQ